LFQIIDATKVRYSTTTLSEKVGEAEKMQGEMFIKEVQLH